MGPDGETDKSLILCSVLMVIDGRFPLSKRLALFACRSLSRSQPENKGLAGGLEAAVAPESDETLRVEPAGFRFPCGVTLCEVCVLRRTP
jgi:hypothetical protein